MIKAIIHSVVCVIICFISHNIVHPYVSDFVYHLSQINFTSNAPSILWMSLAMICFATPICIAMQLPIMWFIDKSNLSWRTLVKMSATMSFISMLTMMMTETILIFILSYRLENLHHHNALHGSTSENAYVLLISLMIAFIVTFFYSYTKHKNHK